MKLFIPWAMVLLIGTLAHAEPTQKDLVLKGESVFRAAGGCSCHVDPEKNDQVLGGGRPIKTPFGTFYSTNITPDPEWGLGAWTEEDFVKAMTLGLHKDGYRLFPVFPYPSYARMKREDLKAMWAYLQTTRKSGRKNREHDVAFPFNVRLSLLFWQWLYLDDTPWTPDPEKSSEWNRGAYLVETVGHCGECHTPKNILGGPVNARYLAGTAEGEGPEGGSSPNLTPHESGLGKWDEVDISYYLSTGMTPDGDFAAGLMAEFIEQGHAHLSEEDRKAIAVYLRSLPPLSAPGEPSGSPGNPK